MRIATVLSLALIGFSSVQADELPLFRAVKQPAVPRVRGPVATPVDAFILQRLEAKGLGHAAQADRSTLLRRLSFDLTGLPPTLAEQEAFLNDTRPDAYERLVERLLNSTAFGERWALFWLDLVRYAESDGFNQDALRPNAYRYRDWVIRAFNADLPYRDFVRWQLAGDELAPDNPDAVIATGYLRLYPDEYNAAQLEQRHQEILDDLTDTTSFAFLGLTFGCARCHDHKYDPISQKDYYRLQSFFAAFYPTEVELSPAPGLAEWQQKTAALRAEMEQLVAAKKLTEAQRGLDRFHAGIQAIVKKDPALRTPYEQQIAYLANKQIEGYRENAAARLPAAEKKKYEQLKAKLAAFGPEPQPVVAMAARDVGATAPPTYRLIGGDWRKPSRTLITPSFPEALGGGKAELSAREQSTGRRAALAEWLTRETHPLTARVFVNRLWQQLTGVGIVATPNDFGVQGSPPSHPELLDWLAADHMAHDWSMKHTIRQIVLSNTYQQVSVTPNIPEVDPSNKLYWRMNRRRLEGETIRDAILAVAGQLNRRPFGVSARPQLQPELTRYVWKPDANEWDRNRRSIYVLARRNLRYPLFEAFDQPDLCTSSAKRLSTTTAPQALALLNGQFSKLQARAWAAQLVGRSQSEQIEQAYRMAWGRSPEQVEVELAERFLQKWTLEELCHALLNTNEFLYLE
ncbi:MAG: DUF1549 and DUF1553 domain-containing protein [Gemmataceae bacterium]